MELINLIEFDETEFVEFLRLLISESEHVQNGDGFTTQESLIADHVLNKLQNHIDSGIIRANKVEYVKDRANLILEYGDESNNKTIAFAGSHFDVVPASKESWVHDPFTLTVDGDKLYGRGTTDCLGHVALVTIILNQLATNNVKLNYKLAVVFIADEEVGKDESIGVLHMDKDGLLDHIKGGPVYWLDASDIVPVLACGTGMAWSLKVYGKKAHTGFPHNGINPLPIAFDVVKLIVEKFNELCPRTTEDDKYKFRNHSNMKPTVLVTDGNLAANQYSDFVEIKGDVRMTPTKYNDPFQLKVDILNFVENLDVHSLTKWHDGFVTKCKNGENEIEAKIEFNWTMGPYCGIVTNLESDGYKLIKDATLTHHPTCDSCSDLGAVPLVKEMQDAGIDIQIIGYGVGDVYHGNDEYCTISGMKKGFDILKTLLMMANQTKDFESRIDFESKN